MVSSLVFYQVGLIALVCLFLILSGLWLSAPAAARPMTLKPLLPRCKHSKKPKPFLGLTRKPCCAACEQVSRLQGCSPLLRHSRRCLRHEAAAVTSTHRSISVPISPVDMGS